MNPHLQDLQPYPFERLAALKAGTTPPAHLRHIALSIGEPKHAAPAMVEQAMINAIGGLSVYPTTKGLPELRQAIAGWLQRRFKLTEGSLDAERHILPVNGTREALFAFAQACIDSSQPEPLVLSPNPFYQIYEGAAFLAGAKPYFLNCTAENQYRPDYDAIPAEIWQRCQLLFLCTPGNPTGAVMKLEDFARVLELADQYDFVIASDECYSEIYFDEQQPPMGLLEACAKLGRHDYSRCAVFHSLSKRSNLPGLRSGFVAGDAELMTAFLRYRTYHGCAMPVQVQQASIAAWDDEQHVEQNRDLYRRKFDAVLDILGDVMTVSRPDAGFYLWPQVAGGDDEAFARDLFNEQHVTVLPGRYLSREADGIPGAGHVRMALVATLEECVEAAQRIRRFVESRL
ncbi:succinyldiaminopimelate aminotransferase [Pokkaliibacter plantistimulans]|uniref:Succinyldiaminopimelate aminotransferase n=1 Tax=Pokkaliibacter plantistimulans TaxID=1635171 RepID=A0ABX5M3J3_9GAMM|nr:succinyldiaminopimelate transaminase [Pokkaliibacter plantistimulans]PXF32954.1 succinyldiaminopimelate aminotransferase [Pokkaliibacter plantistimulans]